MAKKKVAKKKEIKFTISSYKKYADKFIESEGVILSNDKRTIKSKKTTIKNYKGRLDTIINYLTKNRIDITKLDRYDVEKLFYHIQGNGYIANNELDRKVYSKSTMRLLKIVAKKFFEFLKREKAIDRNAINVFDIRINNFKDNKNESEKAIKNKYLNEKELNKVLEYIKQDESNIEKPKGKPKQPSIILYKACLFMLCFGLRLSEVCNLHKEDFSITNDGLLKLHILPSKRGKERDTYLIFNEYKNIISEFIENGDFNFNYNTIQTQLQRVAKKLGIKQLSAHSFRHSFGTYAVNKGISYEIIANMMGHDDIQTTKIYAKLLGVGIERNLVKVLK